MFGEGLCYCFPSLLKVLISLLPIPCGAVSFPFVLLHYTLNFFFLFSSRVSVVGLFYDSVCALLFFFFSFHFALLSEFRAVLFSYIHCSRMPATYDQMAIAISKICALRQAISQYRTASYMKCYTC